MLIFLCILCIIAIAIGIFLISEVMKTKKILENNTASNNNWKTEVRESIVNKTEFKDAQSAESSAFSSLLQEIKHSSDVQGERANAQTENINGHFSILQKSVGDQMAQMQKTIERLETSNSRQISDNSRQVTDLTNSLKQGMKELKDETRQQLQEIKGSITV